MWRKTEYSAMPLSIDTDISSSHVYIRKNIHLIQRDDQILYECEEQIIPKEDWEQYQLANTSAFNDLEAAILELAAIIGG